MQNEIQNSCIVIFVYHFHHLATFFFGSYNCVCLSVCHFLSALSAFLHSFFDLSILISTAVWEDVLLFCLFFSC